jgi:protein tyrosine phosphatase
MLWEHRCEALLMLTNLVEGGVLKCDRYWPTAEEDDVMQYDVMVVTHCGTVEFPHFVVRKFLLEHELVLHS